jgi:hypothetical protein
MNVTIVTKWPQWIVLPLLSVAAVFELAIVGAGFGAPFKKKLMGATIAVAVGLLFVLLIYLPGR